MHIDDWLPVLQRVSTWNTWTEKERLINWQDTHEAEHYRNGTSWAIVMNGHMQKLCKLYTVTWILEVGPWQLMTFVTLSKARLSKWQTSLWVWNTPSGLFMGEIMAMLTETRDTLLHSCRKGCDTTS